MNHVLPAAASVALAQAYAHYTPDDQWVWQTLFARQMQVLPAVASRRFLEGLPRVDFQAAKTPDFAEVKKDRMQDVYFVIDSYEQLAAAMPALEAELRRLLAQQPASIN